MRKWLPLVAISLGTFMLLVDITIVNVALPDMARDLKTSFAALQWVVDAYALSLAAFVLGSGSIADRLGHRRSYAGGLALFAAASLVCGIAPDPAVLVAARVVQGLGGATMLATTFALLNSSYAGRDRGTAYGIWGAVAGASAAIGPIIGGVLTQGASWRWIFFVNLPVSVVTIVLCVAVLDDVHDPHRARIDVAGMASFTAAAGCATYGFISASEHGWATPGTLAVLLPAVPLFAIFFVIEARSDSAMIDLRLLRNRIFGGVLLAALILNFAAFAYATYTSIWLQSVLGLSPIEAGLTGLPLSVAAFAASAAIGRVLHANRPGPVIGTGMLLIGAGGVLGALLLHGGASWPALVPGFALVGLGVGLATPTLSSAAMAAVPPDRGGMAAGMVNTARQLGFAFGLALLGTVFAARAGTEFGARGISRPADLAHAVAAGQARGLLHAAPAPARGALDDAVHAAALAGLQGAFLVAGIAGLLAGLAVLLLVRTPGREARPGDPKPPVPSPLTRPDERAEARPTLAVDGS